MSEDKGMDGLTLGNGGRMPRALDLFCKAGGASMGLSRAGFDVVGVDIEPQPRYPFKFIQGDALNPPVDLNDFDFIWASPPCQGYSEMRHAPGALGSAPKLIGFMRARMEQTDALWVIENVRAARAEMRDPVLLCGSMFNLNAQGCQLQRHRLFEANFPLTQNVCRHASPTIGVYGGHARKRSAKHGGRGTKDVWKGGHAAAASIALGIDWMTLAEMSEAIPPAYAEFIGRAALREFQKTEALESDEVLQSKHRIGGVLHWKT